MAARLAIAQSCGGVEPPGKLGPGPAIQPQASEVYGDPAVARQNSRHFYLGKYRGFSLLFWSHTLINVLSNFEAQGAKTARARAKHGCERGLDFSLSNLGKAPNPEKLCENIVDSSSAGV